MNFKQTLNGAIELHKERQGEIIKKSHIAKVLFSGSKNQRSMSESLRIHNFVKMKSTQIIALTEILPDTDVWAWLSPDACRKCREHFIGKFDLDGLAHEPELTELWELLNDGKMPNNLITKYLYL